MTVDEDGRAEGALGPLHDAAKGAVIGLVVALDAHQCVVYGQLTAVDLGAVGNDPGNGAKPAGNPHRTSVGVGRQGAVEHGRIELVGLAVDVYIGAREMGPHQRCAAMDGAGKQVVDETVFRTAKRVRVEPCRIQQAVGIDRARMRRVEQKRHPDAVTGDQDLKRRIEFWIGVGHGFPEFFGAASCPDSDKNERPCPCYEGSNSRPFTLSCRQGLQITPQFPY